MLIAFLFTITHSLNNICVCNTKCSFLCPKNQYISSNSKFHFNELDIDKGEEIEINLFSEEKEFTFEIDSASFKYIKIIVKTLTNSHPITLNIKNKSKYLQKSIEILPDHQVVLSNNLPFNIIQNLPKRPISTPIPISVGFKQMEITGNLSCNPFFHKCTIANLTEPETNQCGYRHISSCANYKYKFKGVKFAVYGGNGPKNGKYKIELDGEIIQEIDQSKTTNQNTIQFVSDLLDYKEHTVRLLSKGDEYEIYKLTYWPSITARRLNSTEFTKTGIWREESDEIGGVTEYADENGGTASIIKKCKKVWVFGSTDPLFAPINIECGNFSHTINPYSAKRVSGALLYESPELDGENNLLKLTSTGPFMFNCVYCEEEQMHETNFNEARLLETDYSNNIFTGLTETIKIDQSYSNTEISNSEFIDFQLPEGQEEYLFVVQKGFTFDHVKFTFSDGIDNRFGAIKIECNEEVTISNCEFVGCSVKDGNGNAIYISKITTTALNIQEVTAANKYISDCIFKSCGSSNEASIDGFAVAIDDPETVLEIHGSLFSECRGGIIVHSETKSAIIERYIFFECIFDNCNGASILITTPDGSSEIINISKCQFEHCLPTGDCSGIKVSDQSNSIALNINECKFHNCGDNQDAFVILYDTIGANIDSLQLIKIENTKIEFDDIEHSITGVKINGENKEVSIYNCSFLKTKKSDYSGQPWGNTIIANNLLKITISLCQFDNCGNVNFHEGGNVIAINDGSATDVYLVNCTFQSTSACISSYSENVKISGNQFIDSGKNVIRITSVKGGETSGVEITENIFSNCCYGVLIHFWDNFGLSALENSPIIEKNVFENIKLSESISFEKYKYGFIFIVNCLAITFENNTFLNFSTTEGGLGAQVRQSSNLLFTFSFENCYFINNIQENKNGGAININEVNNNGKADIFFKECHFTGNEANKNGGCLSILCSNDVHIEKCEFENNKANNDGKGGAIYIEKNEGALIIDDCKFSNNAAYSGYSIYGTKELEKFTLTRCYFNDDLEESFVGKQYMIVLERGDIDISHVHFNVNSENKELYPILFKYEEENNIIEDHIFNNVTCTSSSLIFIPTTARSIIFNNLTFNNCICKEYIIEISNSNIELNQTHINFTESEKSCGGIRIKSVGHHYIKDSVFLKTNSETGSICYSPETSSTNTDNDQVTINACFFDECRGGGIFINSERGSKETINITRCKFVKCSVASTRFTCIGSGQNADSIDLNVESNVFYNSVGGSGGIFCILIESINSAEEQTPTTSEVLMFKENKFEFDDPSTSNVAISIAIHNREAAIYNCEFIRCYINNGDLPFCNTIVADYLSKVTISECIFYKCGNENDNTDFGSNVIGIKNGKPDLEVIVEKCTFNFTSSSISSYVESVSFIENTLYKMGKSSFRLCVTPSMDSGKGFVFSDNIISECNRGTIINCLGFAGRMSLRYSPIIRNNTFKNILLARGETFDYDIEESQNLFAFAVFGDIPIIFDNNTFSNVIDEYKGGFGGILVQRSDTYLDMNLTFTKCIFKSSTKNPIGGGAFRSSTEYNDGNTYLTFKECQFKSNEVLGNGGALMIYTEKDVLIEDCEFESNKATSSPPDESLNRQGGAVYLEKIGGSMIINNCNFNNNIASEGYSIYGTKELEKFTLTGCNFNDDLDESFVGKQYMIVLERDDIDISNVNFNVNSENKELYPILFKFEEENNIIEDHIFNNVTCTSSSLIFIPTTARSIIFNNLTFNNCICKEYIIEISNSNIELNQTHINFTESERSCGGIRIMNNGQINIENCIFSKTCSITGAICYSPELTSTNEDDEIMINNCYFEECVGGASYFDIKPESIEKINIHKCEFIGCSTLENFNTIRNNSSTESINANIERSVYKDRNSEILHLLFNSSYFYGKQAYMNGGAVSFSNSKDIQIVDCNFMSNKVNGDGGSIFISNAKHISIEKTMFYDNECIFHGGALLIEYDYNPISYSTFLGESNAYCSLIDCTFNGNKAKLYGNAIFIKDIRSSDVIYEIENNTFIDNNCSDCSFDYVIASMKQDLDIYSNMFKNTDETIDVNPIIYLDQFGNPIYKNLIIKNLPRALVINIDSSAECIVNCTFIDCCHNDGYVIRLYKNITFANNTIKFGDNCSSTSGLLVDFTDINYDTQFVIYNTSFHKCSGNEDSTSGICIKNANLRDLITVSECRFEDCFHLKCSVLTIKVQNVIVEYCNISFSNNDYQNSCSGIVSDCEFITLRNNTFINVAGSCVKVTGSPIHQNEDSEGFVMDTNRFAGCNPVSYDGRLNHDHVWKLSIYSNIIITNNIVETIIYKNYYFYIVLREESLILENNTFQNLEIGSKYSGGIGAWIRHFDRYEVQFIQCKFINNRQTQSGGGAYQHGLLQTTANCELTFDGCEFIGNKAAKEGGALSFQTNLDVSILNCIFENNEGTIGGSIYILPDYIYNGEFFSASKKIIIQNCQFQSNKAIEGNAIYVGKGTETDLEISSCSFNDDNIPSDSNSLGYSVVSGCKSTTIDDLNITIKTKAEIQGAINIISSSSIKIKNSNFDARTDNAILLDNSQSMIGKWSINITDCIFYNLNEDGSSIYLLDPTITIIDECNLKNIQSLVNLFRMELSSTKSLDLFSIIVDKCESVYSPIIVLNDNSATTSFRNCIFQQCYCGGLITNQNDEVIFEKCKFISNTVRSNGAFISLKSSQTSTILNCEFESNSATGLSISSCYGGCIYISASESETELGGEVEISNCTFTYNEATKGQSIYSVSSNTKIIIKNNTKFVNDKSEYEVILHSSNLEIRDVNFSCNKPLLFEIEFIENIEFSNTTSYISPLLIIPQEKNYSLNHICFYNCYSKTYIIRVNSEEFQIYDSTISFDEATSNKSCGAIYFGRGRSYQIISTQFIRTYSNGAIYIQTNPTLETNVLKISNCTFASNAGLNTPCFYISCYNTIIFENNTICKLMDCRYSGFIEVYDTDQITLDSCNFIDNIRTSDRSTNQSGGCGIWICNGQKSSDTIYKDKLKIIFQNCNWIRNRALFGGGIQVGIGSLANIELEFTECSFEGNQANNCGALLIQTVQPVLISNCTFINNTATNTNGFGGAIEIDPITTFIDSGYKMEKCEIVNCTFLGNSSPGNNGHSIFLGGGETGTRFTVTQCSFVNNSRIQQSSLERNDVINCHAIYINGTESFISNCQFLNDKDGNSKIGAVYINLSGTHTITDCFTKYNCGENGVFQYDVSTIEKKVFTLQNIMIENVKGDDRLGLNIQINKLDEIILENVTIQNTNFDGKIQLNLTWQEI